MSEDQALVPAGWVDSCPWATLLGLHSRAEQGWDVHFWFWSPQHHFYWPTHCPVLYLLREGLAGAQLQPWTRAIITLSQLLLTSLGWWIFHGLLRPRLNHRCHLQATPVSYPLTTAITWVITMRTLEKLALCYLLLGRCRSGQHFPKLDREVHLYREAHFSIWTSLIFKDQKCSAAH